MLKNYLLVALRSLRRNKTYAFINIIGLTLGITACLLIGLYIWKEMHYDKFHEKADRIVRVTMEYGEGSEKQEAAVTGTKVGPEFARKFPAVEAFTRTIIGTRVVANGEKKFTEKKVLFADSSFFHIFSFKLVEGDPATCLSKPDQIVISEAIAQKYFGSTHVLGKTLRLSDQQDFTISGIAAEIPGNSQIQFDMVAPFITLGAAKQEEQWFTANYVTYLLLQNAEQIKPLQSQVSTYLREVSTTIFSNGEGYLTHKLEPLTRVHLYSTLDGLEPSGSITYIYVLGIIALLILFIAGVNYANLATAMSSTRGTEVGIRKVLGANQRQLRTRFLGESFILTLISLLLGIIATIILLPSFNNIAGSMITFRDLFSPQAIGFMILLVLSISLLAGAYPAFILSGNKMNEVLKSGIRISASGGILRKGMIVLQFVIAVFLIVATIIVTSQLKYIQNKELGYDKEGVMILPADFRKGAGFEEMKTALLQIPGINSVTAAYESPSFVQWSDGLNANTAMGKKSISINAIPAELDFVKTLGMQLLAGRDFIKADLLEMDTANNGANYKASFLLNETAVKALGWSPEQAIGKTVDRGISGTVKGVVKDFHFASLHQPIGPLVIFLEPDMVQQVFVKVNRANIGQTIGAMEKTWRSRIQHRPFEYRFLDEDFNALYIAEQKTAKVFSLFAGMAILLACLGLFALSAFVTVQRTKEIGIRKVLGATRAQIVMLISKEFLLLVTIGMLIAMPLAWWAGREWLADFAYRIDISSWMFLLAAVVATVIAFVSVALQSGRAAGANPVNSLKS